MNLFSKTHILLTFSFIIIILCKPSIAATTITAYCPKPTDLTRTMISNSWAKYQYTGQAAINLPDINNRLYFTGDSNAESANYFSGATWTDRTFLCLYNYQDDAIVIYENQLSPFVDRCYFAKPGISECTSANPDACAITCELSSENG